MKASVVGDMDTLSKRLSWVLAQKNLSARQLSLKAGIAPGLIGVLVRDPSRNPATSTIAAVATAAGVDYAWLATGNGSPELDTADRSSKHTREPAAIRVAHTISKDDRSKLRALADAANPGWPTFAPEVVRGLLDALDALDQSPENVSGSKTSGHDLSTFHGRALFAYQCLPPTRARRGNRITRPSLNSLTKDHGLHQGSLSRLFNGERVAPCPDTVVKIAAALNVSIGWLVSGMGQAPSVSNHGGQ